MQDFSTGLSLALGRVLTAWAEQLDPPGLERYLEIGGFQGLAGAAKQPATEVISQLRTSGLRDRGPTAEPVYRSWQRFQRRHQPGLLVVNAVQLDPRGQAGAFLLDKNPYGLLEGLLVAVHACEVDKVLVLLPPEFQHCEAGLLNAWEMVHMVDLHLERPFDLELVRTVEPSIWEHGYQWEGEEPALVHHLETWYHVALVMSLGAKQYRSLGLEDHHGTYLLTMGGEVKHPGVVESPIGGDLWQTLETLAGGVPDEQDILALALDDGMGGFLSPSQARIPLAPEEMAAAGVSPAPGTIWALSREEDVVELTRQALYRYWLLSGEESSPERVMIARALRMVTEIIKGKGRPASLTELENLARELGSLGLAAAWPLYSSLAYFREHWEKRLATPFKRPPAPCQNTCPAGIDIPSFLAQIGHGRHKQATGTISKDNPLPYSCGLICPAPCEGACLRGEMDAPIHIRAMKAVAAKHSLAQGGYPKPRRARSTGKRVAVVGSGPGGLTCAYYLALRGHQVTIFEAQVEPGGMLRYGIPAYRLPREVLDQELGQLTRLGIEIHTGREIKDLNELRAQGFDAIFLALGIQLSRLIPIEGVDLPFVLGGLDFLKDVRSGRDPRVGPRVIVVGGGNVAIDVALTALRQGGRRVDLFCLEKRREMPASPHELATALAEGVAINNSWGPVKISPDGVMTFQQCTRVFDDRGRFSPQFNPERTTSLQADHVLLAIGQATDLACVEEGSDIEVMRGFIKADPETLMTREPGVFAGGDVVHGPQTVVMAVRAGKRAAASIDAYLRGRPLDSSRLEPTPRSQVEPVPVSAVARTNLRRSAIPYVDVKDRRGNFQHIELGLTDDMALNESRRCLRCDLCIGCGLCQLVCSEMGVEALRLRQTEADRLAFNDFTRPSTRCVGCGACAQACPTGAIRLEDVDGFRRTVLTGTVVREQKLLECSQCGQPYLSQAYLDHLKKRVGPTAVAHVDRQVCPQCARKHRAEELAGRPFFNQVAAG